MTAMCQEPQVVCDADIFAALAGHDLATDAAAAFDGRLRYVAATAVVLASKSLTHLYDGYLTLAPLGAQIDPLPPSASRDEALRKMAGIRALAGTWDKDWAPPRAEAVLLSVLASQSHHAPLLTAHPGVPELMRQSVAQIQMLSPRDLVLFLAHRGVLSVDDAAALGEELGCQFDPGRTKKWRAEREAYRELADEAARGDLCDAH